MRVFFSTGEASGELVAAELLGALRARVHVDAEGVGGERLERAGVTIVRRTRGWASMGVFAALGKIPKLLTACVKLALRIRANPPDVVVLVDFGAFNLRLAWLLRRLGLRRPIVYYAPPAAWLDDPKRARAVAALCDPLTLFRHQAEFYRSLKLPIGYVGHPLVSTIPARAPRPLAAADGGVLALLPGSRSGEIERHMPRLLDAVARIREVRPNMRAVVVAVDDEAQRHVEHLLSFRSPLPVEIARETRGVLRDADVAIVASGTAVLEAALVQTPAVALYVLSEAQMKIARRIYKRPYITLPNLVLDEPVIPELIQEAATPAALCDAALALLAEPSAQHDGYERLRTALGPPDALQRNADWVLRTVAESRPVAAVQPAAG
ncbi:MAG TPA: lipid-A-disaccharide synthase [Candidatus Elarobacter sp.]